eukprot:UN08314
MYGVIMVYDITNRKSFQHLNEWNRIIDEYGRDNYLHKMIIGNKSNHNMNNVSIVSYDEAKSLATRLFSYYPIHCVQASAKNVDKAIKQFAKQIYDEDKNSEERIIFPFYG